MPFSAASKRKKKPTVLGRGKDKSTPVPRKSAQKVPASSSLERLQKYMARRGVGSRRKCEQMILAGCVKVNGVVAQLGCKVDPTVDRVEVDDRPIPDKVIHYYVAMNKPPGYITACSDRHGSKLVIDLLPKKLLKAGVVPVGRLDKATGGLLLFTSDGEMVYRLTHPSYSVWKTYRVTVKGNPTEEKYRQLREGVTIDGHLTSPAKVEQIKRSKGRAVFNLTIHEGRKRQIRRMCKAIGHPVLELFRTRIGPITIGRLGPGEHRNLTETEIETLKSVVGIR